MTERRTIPWNAWLTLVGILAIFVSLWINASQQRMAIGTLAQLHASEWGQLTQKVIDMDARLARVEKQLDYQARIYSEKK